MSRAIYYFEASLNFENNPLARLNQARFNNVYYKKYQGSSCDILRPFRQNSAVIIVLKNVHAFSRKDCVLASFHGLYWLLPGCMSLFVVYTSHFFAGNTLRHCEKLKKWLIFNLKEVLDLSKKIIKTLLNVDS